MAGPAHAELAAAMSSADGFGLFRMVRESPQLIAHEVTALRAATDRPSGVNLIAAAMKPSLLST
nr:hypothetical protein [Paraburkholderia hospita]